MRLANVQRSDHQADPAKINKGRRRNMRIPMVMDEIDGRINRLANQG
jgi:hypothetical protein